MVGELIKAGASVRAKNRRGISCFTRPHAEFPARRCGIRQPKQGAVRRLLDLGANPGIRNKSGPTAMTLALHNTGLRVRLTRS
jgi:hypothetical protein